MKRLFAALLLLLTLCSCLFSCGEEAGKTEGQDLTPLFRFAAAEGGWEETRLFYLPESRGYLYLHPKENGGFTGGFVSPERSLSCEAMLESDAPLSSVSVWENGKDRAHILTDRELFLALPAENASHRTALDEGVVTAGALSVDPLSFLAPTEDLILLHPVDFSETYVLAQTSLLPDFACLLTASHDGKRIWYAKGRQGAYTGLAFFEYGSNLPLGNETVPFDAFLPVGQGKLLLTRKMDGGTLYTYRDLETGTVRTYFTETQFHGCAASCDGRVLALVRNVGEGSEVAVVDLVSGKLLCTCPISYGYTSPSIALSADGAEALLAIGKGEDELLATLQIK